MYLLLDRSSLLFVITLSNFFGLKKLTGKQENIFPLIAWTEHNLGITYSHTTEKVVIRELF